ncbi:MAG: hypothetical protein GC151_08460 [Betaproteobacteria bacterium]|nr:hypothetical protein [Betaproteobacteria bacterium]
MNRPLRALAFDTGGTILDWHTGFREAFEAAGARHGCERDWAGITNEYRRRTLGAMLNYGKDAPATRNFDDVHRDVLDELLQEQGLEAFTPDDRRAIAWDALHGLRCWSDFPDVLPILRRDYVCVSFTLLSFRIIIDTARANGLSWDAVISCEAIGKYKVLPESYLTCARFLQFDPGEICMVACHNFDLDAAKACGFRTAFVHRPAEWGHEPPPSPVPSAHHDIVAEDFPALARRLAE